MFTPSKSPSHDDTPMDRQEAFVSGVYAVVDQAIALEIDHLRRHEGVVPTCASGCSHCCRHHILTNVLEAHTLARHIRRFFSGQEIRDLKRRTRQWHAWDNSMPGRHPRSDVEGKTDLNGYVHRCPLVVDGACSAYAARPLVCRIHYVCSPVTACYAASKPGASLSDPVTLTSIKTAAQPFSRALRDHIEEKGLDFSRTVMLLPHWLATEMEWNFDS